MSQPKINPLMQFIPLDEAMQRLQISRDEMMALVQDDVVKGYQYGKEIYLDLGEIEALITSRMPQK
jgi:hypothetical protein